MGVPGIIVALDGMTREDAVALIDQFGERVSTYKVGLELFTRYGPSLVRAVGERGKGVFLDTKYHDIPTTVAGAVAAACDLGVRFVSVHAAGGEAMMRAAAGGRAGSKTGLLGVTVLTSETREDVGGEVEILAGRAHRAGMDGVVAAVGEVGRIKSVCGDGFLVITPGIRLAGVGRDDQARVATPGEAAEAGSDYVVVGRAVTRAVGPLRALARVEEQLRLGQ